jgi:hypothetical protein
LRAGSVSWCSTGRSSGGGRERSDAGERADEVVLPGPAGWEVQRALAGGAGQSAGELQQPARTGGGAPRRPRAPPELCARPGGRPPRRRPVARPASAVRRRQSRDAPGNGACYPGPARQSPPPGWRRSAGEEAERTVGYELWLSVHAEMPGLRNEFQLEGAGSPACSRMARVGMAPSCSPTRSSVGTSNGTRRRPGEHRGGSTQAGHGGTVLSATNRLQRQSRTPIQPPQSDPPGRPARARARRAAPARCGPSFSGRNLDLARRSTQKPRIAPHAASSGQIRVSCRLL